MKVSKKRLTALIAEAVAETIGLDHSNRGREEPLGDTGPVVEEEKEKGNPWAICTASVGREDKAKYERCVQDVKKETGYKD